MSEKKMIMDELIGYDKNRLLDDYTKLREIKRNDIKNKLMSTIGRCNILRLSKDMKQKDAEEYHFLHS
jgi:hypothetical protein